MYLMEKKPDRHVHEHKHNHWLKSPSIKTAEFYSKLYTADTYSGEYYHFIFKRENSFHPAACLFLSLTCIRNQKEENAYFSWEVRTLHSPVCAQSTHLNVSYDSVSPETIACINDFPVPELLQLNLLIPLHDAVQPLQEQPKT